MDNLISLEKQLEANTIGDKVEALAESLIGLESELETLEFMVNERRKQLLDAMDQAKLSSIKSRTGAKITVIETQKYIIDRDTAMEIIDAQTPEVKDKLIKVNDSEFRKLFPSCEAISLGKKTRYIKVETK